MQTNVALEANRKRWVSSRREQNRAAARRRGCINGAIDGVGIERLAIAARAKVAHVELAIANGRGDNSSHGHGGLSCNEMGVAHCKANKSGGQPKLFHGKRRPQSERIASRPKQTPNGYQALIFEMKSRRAIGVLEQSIRFVDATSVCTGAGLRPLDVAISKQQIGAIQMPVYDGTGKDQASSARPRRIVDAGNDTVRAAAVWCGKPPNHFGLRRCRS